MISDFTSSLRVKWLLLCFLAVFVTLPTVASAQCTPNALGVHFLDLKLPFSINTTPFGNPSQNATMLVPGSLKASTNPACVDDGWYEALLEVTIPAGCTRANIWVEYEGTPIDWTLNVGDSPGDNGFGGDAGEPDSEAELQVLDDTLSVYSIGLGPGDVDRLAHEHLGLTDGALQISVGNQYVSWGQPFSELDSTNAEHLFKLPDAASSKPDTFYLGINRVVAGPGLRTGCGARRVMVSFR